MVRVFFAALFSFVIFCHSCFGGILISLNFTGGLSARGLRSWGGSTFGRTCLGGLQSDGL